MFPELLTSMLIQEHHKCYYYWIQSGMDQHHPVREASGRREDTKRTGKMRFNGKNEV